MDNRLLDFFSGSSRNCLCIGNIAVKIPKVSSLRRFLVGWIHNINERQRSVGQNPSRAYAPCIWSLFGGLVNIYPRCEQFPTSFIPYFNGVYNVWYHVALKDNIWFINTVEKKPSSFGVLNNRIVAIDYGDD